MTGDLQLQLNKLLWKYINIRKQHNLSLQQLQFFLKNSYMGNIKVKLEIAAQGVAQCKVSATHVVVDAALRRIG